MRDNEEGENEEDDKLKSVVMDDDDPACDDWPLFVFGALNSAIVRIAARFSRTNNRRSKKPAE